MPAQPSGNPNSRGSARLAVGKHDLQLAEHHVPILAPGVPMLHDSLGCQVQHPPQRIVVGKRRFVLGDLSELTIQPFDDVRRVYDFPNLGRISELITVVLNTEVTGITRPRFLGSDGDGVRTWNNTGNGLGQCRRIRQHKAGVCGGVVLDIGGSSHGNSTGDYPVICNTI